MYKALKSFSGLVSMVSGEIKDISDPIVIKDLVKAGYIVEVKPAKAKAEEEEKPEPKKRAKKTAKEEKTE